MREREEYKAVRALARQRKDAVALIEGGLGLTRRQAEVVHCVVLRDLTADETAAALGIHVRTVNGHLARLRRQHEVSRIGLAKRVCGALCGELDREAVGANGRLRLNVLRARFALSSRLAAVLRLIWEERSSKEIARALALSTHTAVNYRRRLRDALGESSTVALVRRVFEELTRTGF